MSTEMSGSLDSDCGPSDPNWRDSTYLDSLGGLPERDYERKLGEVLLWRKFVPQQPPEFREFGGCRARLHISALEIDEVRQKTLLVAIAGSGAGCRARNSCCASPTRAGRTSRSSRANFLRCRTTGWRRCIFRKVGGKSPTNGLAAGIVRSNGSFIGTATKKRPAVGD